MESELAPTPRRSVPLLVLLVGLTALGLFIRSLPIGAGTIIDISR